MRLDDITPILLTFNEEPNIGRSLAPLAWARDIVVVDSHSTDRTVEIVKRSAQARLFQRPFDTHERQWNFALGESGIASEWVLTLDADYILTDAFIRELEGLDATGMAGYEAQFRYFVHGRPLSRSIYPGRVVLFRRRLASFQQDGHTQRVRIDGPIGRLAEQIGHDDRKPLRQWIVAQGRYAELERAKLAQAKPPLNAADRIRRWRVVAPLAVLFHCLIGKRMIFEGLAGWYYTFQRVLAETLLSLYLIEDRLTRRDRE